MARYYVWAPLSEVHHDGHWWCFWRVAAPDCNIATPFEAFRDWQHGPRPPKGRRLCKRCRTKRRKMGE